MVGKRCSHLRLTRSCILTVFMNLTESEVNAIINQTKALYPDLLNPSPAPDYNIVTKVNMHSASVSDGLVGNNLQGYWIVQWDRKGAPIPWGVANAISRLVNDLAFGTGVFAPSGGGS